MKFALSLLTLLAVMAFSHHFTSLGVGLVPGSGILPRRSNLASERLPLLATCSGQRGHVAVGERRVEELEDVNFDSGFAENFDLGTRSRHRTRRSKEASGDGLSGRTVRPASGSPFPSSLTSSFALDCEHYARCSGCVLDKDLNEPPVMREAKMFFDRIGVNDFSLTTCGVWEWRCRAKLAVRGTSEDPRIGLYEEGSHQVVDIPNCRAHHPRINAAVNLVREAIRALKVEPYNEDTQTGQLRYLQMVVTTFNSSVPVSQRYAEGKVQVTLVWNAKDQKSENASLLESMANYLWENGGEVPKEGTKISILHSVWANFQTTSSNIIFGGRWRHLVGGGTSGRGSEVQTYVSHRHLLGRPTYKRLTLSSEGYRKKVRRGSSVVELYAGVGVIGISLAVTRSCRFVKCVEVNKEAKESFQLSLARLPSTLDCKISWHCADASVSPTYWLEGADVVVVDPPRKGLDASVLEALRVASLRGQGKQRIPQASSVTRVEKRPWIARANQESVVKEGIKDQQDMDLNWPDTLIYISCGWESFKRDYAALTAGEAWHLSDGHAFNFFPGTDSIETLAVFKRGKKGPAKPAKTHTGVGKLGVSKFRRKFSR